MYSKAAELRSMFTDAVNKVVLATASQGPKTQVGVVALYNFANLLEKQNINYSMWSLNHL